MGEIYLQLFLTVHDIVSIKHSSSPSLWLFLKLCYVVPLLIKHVKITKDKEKDKEKKKDFLPTRISW